MDLVVLTRRGEGPISGKHRLKRNRNSCTPGLNSRHNPDCPYRNWGKALRLEVLVKASVFSFSSFYLPAAFFALFCCGTSYLSNMALKTRKGLVSGSDHQGSAL